MNSDLFKLISPDAFQHGAARRIKIPIKKWSRQISKSETCGIDCIEQNISVLRHDDRGMQIVGLASQHHELFARRPAVARFVETTVLERQRLVRAHDNALWHEPGDGF